MLFFISAQHFFISSLPNFFYNFKTSYFFSPSIFSSRYFSGVAAVFNLVCSDHAMVRRAATEIFCNMAGHESVLKVRTFTQLYSSLIRYGF